MVEGTETDLGVPLQSELDTIYERFHDEVGYPGINATLHSVQQNIHGQAFSKSLENM